MRELPSFVWKNPGTPPSRAIPGLEPFLTTDRPIWTAPWFPKEKEDAWFYLLGMLANYQMRELYGRNPESYTRTLRELAFAYHVRFVWPTHVLPIKGARA